MARGLQELIETGLHDKVFKVLDTMQDSITASKLSDVKVSHSGGQFIAEVCERYKITLQN